jgi:hypothetical protein
VGRRTWDARRRRRAGDSCHPLLLPARGNRPPVTPLTYAALGGQCLAQRIANATLGAPSDQGNALHHRLCLGSSPPLDEMEVDKICAGPVRHHKHTHTHTNDLSAGLTVKCVRI